MFRRNTLINRHQAMITYIYERKTMTVIKVKMLVKIWFDVSIDIKSFPCS
jgi:hypothetical protein